LWILPVIAQAQLIDLGATTGYPLNNSGEAALASGVYANGAVVPVPALSNQFGAGVPYAINDNGQSAGSAGLNEGAGASGVNPRVATLYSGTTATDLFPAADDTGNQNADWSGTATSINSAGTVLGYHQIQNPPMDFRLDDLPAGYAGGVVLYGCRALLVAKPRLLLELIDVHARPTRLGGRG
jgi:hypothetical protein